MEYVLSTGGLVVLLHGEAVGVECPHCRWGYLVRGTADMNIVLRQHIEDVAGRGLRNDQRMARRARHDVEKGQDVSILIDLVAGQFAAQDFRKDVVRIVSGHVGS